MLFNIVETLLCMQTRSGKSSGLSDYRAGKNQWNLRMSVRLTHSLHIFHTKQNTHAHTHTAHLQRKMFLCPRQDNWNHMLVIGSRVVVDVSQVMVISIPCRSVKSPPTTMAALWICWYCGYVIIIFSVCLFDFFILGLFVI